MDDIIARIQQLSAFPEEPEAFAAWLELTDAISFIKDNGTAPDLVLYAGIECLFMHAVAVPAATVQEPDVDDLMEWNLNPCSSWSMSIRYSDPKELQLSPPLEHTGSKSLDRGEQLIYLRSFQGRIGDKSYVEILQKLTHAMGLHFLAERSAYCRLDDHGDIEDLIRIHVLPSRSGEYGGTVVTARREVIDEFLAMTDSALVTMFDVTRFRPSSFGGWQHGRERHVESADAFWDWHIERGHASYMRGCQIIRSRISKQQLIERATGRRDEDKHYASFLACDWKNGELKEISCAPGATANYFTKSDLPFEMSPAFFKPEVLLKYKADPDKYRMTNRSIACRESWYLQTFDINEAGQVHTYLVYLRSLPYEEQLYWKSHNEAPKAPISKRAFKSDFEGSWDLEYDPLESLKDQLQRLNLQCVPWWTLRSHRTAERVDYPVTNSAEEWANEILLLDQFVVEGFDKRWLKTKAGALGRTVRDDMGSLKLTEEVLAGLGIEDPVAVAAPLRELHHIRSKVKGHASGQEAEVLKREILQKHGSYRKHFRSLCEACDEAVKIITAALNNGASDGPPLK